tara:strand:+ start:5066 stop:5203 length:138 start_codon:yes stop_codon:yes gene_type:complete
MQSELTKKVILLIANNRDQFSRDDLHSIAKYADSLIVERFILGGK